ncbi:SpoVG family protein [Hominifimenecus sp. rT4P-3]|uniref:SpoVG family protein n=1 Tax=Hominifimenecus sp. rT4P-3 TaxID=3242979 RepID=UPI003DA2D277
MAAKKQAAPAKEQKQKNPSIQVRIDRLNDYEGSSVKAFASANIGGAFAIHGIRVVDSQKGLFVSMPQNSYKDGNGNTKYSDIFHAITAEARNELNEKVTEAYEQALQEQQQQDETEAESESQDMAPSM